MFPFPMKHVIKIITRQNVKTFEINKQTTQDWSCQIYEKWISSFKKSTFVRASEVELCPELNRGGLFIYFFRPDGARVIRFLPRAPIGFPAGQKHPNPIIKPDY